MSTNSLVGEEDDIVGFKQVDLDNHADYTHDNITRGALDEVAAIYIASVLRPGQFDLVRQNTSEVLRLYFDAAKNARARYELAVEEIVEGLGMAQLKVHQSPKLTMNNEMIAEGNSHLNTLRKQIVTLSKEGTPSWTVVRMLIGEYLYTLQDFYSNTNWIELGHGALNLLGWNDTLEYPVAGIDQPTCVDCQEADEKTNGTGNCIGNLIDNGDVLTSGYIDKNTNSQGGIKPFNPQWPQGKGKCSHGGKLDYSHLLPASGGINKATISPVLSPHFYLHSKAGSIAISATKDFFVRNESSLLTVMGYIRLGKLLGLGDEIHQKQCVQCNDPDVSIVFVIDTTGSMSDDIFQVREKAVEIVTKAMMPGFSPANYILTTFNDPASLTTYQVSTDGNQVKSWLFALTVNGGDDCPEYAMSGLKTAMTHARNESCVFLFTDADPKDPELFSDVKMLMAIKNLHLISIITGQCVGELDVNGTDPKKDCASTDNKHRTKRGWGNFYQSLGGTYIPVKDRDISKPMDKLLEKNMAIKYVNNFTATLSSKSLKIQVDSHITAFTVEIKGAVSPPKSALHRPDGSVESFTGKNSFNDIGRNTYIMSVVGPDVGMWVLNNRDATTWTVTVKQQGDIEFTHKFLENFNGALLPVHGSPLAGSTLKLLVKVTGLNAEDSLMFAVLLDESRIEIGRFNLTESTQGRRRIGTVSFNVPSKPFLVTIEGMESGNIFQRQSQGTIHPSSASIRILESDGNIYVGKDTTISCEISNTGSTTETYQVQFMDTARFVDTATSTQSVTVVAGASKVVLVQVHGRITPKTTMLNVKLLSRGKEVQTQQIALLVYTMIPPTVTVIHKSSDCRPTTLNYFNCTTQAISITCHIESTSGLHMPYTRPVLRIDLQVNGSKYVVNMRGNCCRPKFTLLIVDNATLHTEKKFDFTNGRSFSSVIPVNEPSSSKSSKELSIKSIIYGTVGAVGACLAVIGVIILAKYYYDKTPSKVSAERYSGENMLNIGPRMPRSYLRHFRK